MKLFNVPLKKLVLQKLELWHRKIATWLQVQSLKIPVKTQQLALIIICMLITVYCVLLIIQPFIN
jgi:hypothetical protein